MVNWNEVEEIVRGTRVVHEQLLHACGIESTAGTCLEASFVLRMSLENFGRCRAMIRGGNGTDDGGAVDADGCRHGHFWVEGVAQNGVAFLADVTADQFGHPPIYLERADLSRSRYQPGSDEVVLAAVTRFEASLKLPRQVEWARAECRGW